MCNASDIKNRFHARLEAADARENDFRRALLADGTRALRPVLGVLTLMSEVLDERDNVHGSITGLECEIDGEDFVSLRATLHGAAGTDHRLVVKYGPELGGRDLISVSGLGQLYAEKLAARGGGAAASLGRSVGSDLHLDIDRGEDLAEAVREMVEAYFAGGTVHAAGSAERHARFAVMQ